MTLRASDTGPVELYAVGSGLFLSAVMSVSGARSAAQETRWAYLAHDPGSAVEDDRWR